MSKLRQKSETILKDKEPADLMPQTPHVEHHSTGSEHVRDIVIGMSVGLTVPFVLIAANGVTTRFLSSKKSPSIRRVVRAPKRWKRIVEQRVVLRLMMLPTKLTGRLVNPLPPSYSKRKSGGTSNRLLQARPKMGFGPGFLKSRLKAK
jgi:hypothetical protein